MTYCTKCGNENISIFADSNGSQYQVIDDFKKWGESAKNMKKTIIIYSAYLCNDCGNLFARGKFK